MTAPIPFLWDGESFSPHKRFVAECDRVFVVGEVYRLAVHEDRSANSHRHYFASVNEAWLNLPEEMAERFPTSEHLRKHCLIKTGYHDSTSIVCSSRAEALRVAAFIRSIDEYAVVTVEGPVVTRYVAKSQDMRSMGKATFQASKQAVLDYAASLIGVSPDALSSQGKAA